MKGENTSKDLALIAPLAAFFLVFFLIPFFYIFYRSLWDPSFTLKHYIHIIQEPLYLRVIFNTIKLAFVATVVCLILGYPFAFLLATTSEKTSNRLLAIVLIPFWISLLVRTYSWIIILGRKGLINSILLKIGIIDEPLTLLYTMKGVIIGMTHILLPYMIISLFSVMRGIDLELLKAARNLGANSFNAFIRIFFPLSLPGVTGGSLMVFVMGLGFFVTPALLGGPKDVVISVLIENQVTFILNWGFAFAVAIVLCVIALAMVYFYNRYMGILKVVGGES
jgi:ABC-type spermidine/putrescine transport system permease subunit I